MLSAMLALSSVRPAPSVRASAASAAACLLTSTSIGCTTGVAACVEPATSRTAAKAHAQLARTRPFCRMGGAPRATRSAAASCHIAPAGPILQSEPTGCAAMGRSALSAGLILPHERRASRVLHDKPGPSVQYNHTAGHMRHTGYAALVCKLAVS